MRGRGEDKSYLKSATPNYQLSIINYQLIHAAFSQSWELDWIDPLDSCFLPS